MRLSDAVAAAASTEATQGSWLAVGRPAARALRAAGLPAEIKVRVVRDVHRALEVRHARNWLGCVIHAPRLADRPEEALALLRRHLGTQNVLIVGAQPSARLRRAARARGVSVVPPPSVRGAPGHLPRADESIRRETTGVPERFAGGCLEHLEDPDALVRYTAESLRDASGAARVTVMLLDDDHRSLRVREGLGIDPALVNSIRCPLGRGIAGRAASQGRALAGRGSRGGPRLYAGSAYVVLPLGEGQETVGVVNLTGLPEDALPANDLLAEWAHIAVLAGRAIVAARRLSRAEALMATDTLTGLPNRRAFERALAREVDRATRSGDGLAVAIFDADRFKRVNDEYGHQSGDRVLVHIAATLNAAFRDSDLVARWGGEEFAVLLPGQLADHPEASLRALERARRDVGRRPVRLGAGLPSHSITVSCGVAFHPVDGRDGPALVRAADAALYQAKDAGRNTIRRAQGRSAE